MFSTSLANGLRVLAGFNSAVSTLTNAELARITGLSRATISRITYTLVELDLLRFDEDLAGYRIGSGALSLGYPFLAGFGIHHLALPQMQGYAELQRGSVSLGVRDRASMVYVETCRSHDALQFRPDAGAAIPLLTSAMGRAWLCAQTEPAFRQATSELRALLPGHWRQHRAGIMNDRARWALDGYCVVRGLLHEDVHSVATALPSQVNGQTLVLNCVVPASILGGDDVGRRAGPGLVEVARCIDTAWRRGQ